MIKWRLRSHSCWSVSTDHQLTASCSISPQGGVSCIVTVWWITSMCVGTEAAAPAGTKHRHASVGLLWVEKTSIDCIKEVDAAVSSDCTDIYEYCFALHFFFLCRQIYEVCHLCAAGCFRENHSPWGAQVLMERAAANTVSMKPLSKTC